MLVTKILSVAVAIIATLTINADAKLFRTNADLNIREQPSIKAKIIRVAQKGSNVDVTCQTTGDTVNGKNIWDKLADGSYCFDGYVDGAVGLARCDNPPPANPPATSANNGKINEDGLNIIKEFEGFRKNFYNDPAGFRSIGYGHNCKADPTNCNNIHAPITPAQGEDLLRSDVAPKEDCVKKLAPANIDSNKFSALVSFAYNLGCPYLGSSSLLKKLNAGDIKGAANEFALYNRGGGKVLPGLVRRRKAERDLFCKSGGC
ncbi:23144_t:CDS:2 [Dentiscutata erythropus]|uniref:23144_t:CDS:1 n=1 Tax=Dentiscutata erythropus TaxID=1348616 RepID=A0A9N9ED48_9GLOM|nr:23144_t:CDS:2 [Dentiscutata erythropus]